MAAGAETDRFAVQLARDWRALPLDDQERAMLAFTEKLTLESGAMTEDDVRRLRAVGFVDEDILEITVVGAWYNFVSRLASGLGIGLESEKEDSPVLRDLPWQARVG